MGRLTAIFLSLIQVAAFADESTQQCVNQQSAFEGKSALSYAEVGTGSADEKIMLYSIHPSLCSEGGKSSCALKAQPKRGETVAVGVKCGDWAQVEYFGKSKTIVGWLRVSNLRNERSVPARRNMMKSGSPAQEPSFKLTKGFHLPVCEAYLQRLNLTEFVRPAYCGRPENAIVPEFKVLSRVALSQTQTTHLVPWLLVVTEPASFLTMAQLRLMNETGGVISSLPQNPNLDKSVNEFLNGRSMSWQYKNPVDISNNRKPVQAMVWSPDSVDNARCGLPRSGPTPSSDRTREIAFVLSADAKDIDQKQTINIFGFPNGGVHAPVRWVENSKVTDFVRAFQRLGSSYGIFEYREVFYFDTFFDSPYQMGAKDPNRIGDFAGRRKNDSTLKNVLGVFQRKNDRTKQVCEYAESLDQ